LFVGNTNIIISDERSEPTLKYREIFFFTRNAAYPIFSTRIKLTAVSTLWDGINPLGIQPITTNFNNVYYEADNNQEIEYWNGYDFITSQGNDNPPSPVYTFGLYKITFEKKEFENYVNLPNYFYLDYRDTRCPQYSHPIWHGFDLWIKYDYQNQSVKITQRSDLIGDGGDGDHWITINNGEYISIWSLQQQGNPSSLIFQDFWSNSLAVLLQYNSSGKVTPFVVWGPKPNYNAWGYHVYRSIVDNGQPAGAWTLISTINDPQQYTFSDATIDESVLSSGGKTTYYKVTAFNDNGQTEPTNTKGIILPYIQSRAVPYFQNEISMAPLIQWSSQEGFHHTGFKLYRSIVGIGQPAGTYTLIGTFPDPGHLEELDTTISSRQTGSGEYVAYYKITAYNQTTETTPGTVVHLPLARFASTVGSTYYQDNILIPYLSWSAISNFSGLAGYKIYRYIYPTEYQYSLIAQVGPSQLNYSDHTLSIGGNKTAYYKVKGYKSTAESDFSNRTHIVVSWGALKYGQDTTLNDPIQERSSLVEQNYPNPFNPNTIIRYHLPFSGIVKITVTNILGQEVAVLENAYKSEGSHSVSFNATGLPSGIYYYTVHNGTRTEIKKMIYLR